MKNVVGLLQFPAYCSFTALREASNVTAACRLHETSLSVAHRIGSCFFCNKNGGPFSDKEKTSS